MQRTFNYYQDPGHGWVKVPRDLLKTLRIEDKISSYSYQRGKYAYLEEDGDLRLFIEAYFDLMRVSPLFREYHTNRQSRIRSYMPYESEWEQASWWLHEYNAVRSEG